MAATHSQTLLKLSSLPSEVRGIILDHVFSGTVILFDDPSYQLATRGWSLAFLRTSQQIHTEGMKALSRAFRRTTIKYRNCMPIQHHQGVDNKIHHDFIRKYGRLFETMEILRLPPGHINLSLYPNIKRLTIGHFTHRIWSLYLPKMVFPRFSDILDKGILEAWDTVVQRTRGNDRRYPVEDFVLDVLDGRGWGGEKRRWKLYIRLVVQAQTPGNALIDADERRVVERNPDLSAGARKRIQA